MRQRRSGFTLIELLIVVVIIGVLAAIAIPKFQNTKGKANLAAIKSDLRNLATAEEAYFYTNGTYTTSLASLNVNPSPGVSFTFATVNGGGGGRARRIRRHFLSPALSSWAACQQPHRRRSKGS